MTHEAGLPWNETVKKYNGSPPKGTDIPQDLMKQFFKKLASKMPDVSHNPSLASVQAIVPPTTPPARCPEP